MSSDKTIDPLYIRGYLKGYDQGFEDCKEMQGGGMWLGSLIVITITSIFWCLIGFLIGHMVG